MRVPFRAGVAFALVCTFFFVKHHLDSISGHWQSAKAQAAQYVGGSTNIELVSSARVSSAQHIATPTSSKKWLEPTKPALAKNNFVPQQIPVEVPEPEPFDWYLDDYLDDLSFEAEMERIEKEQEQAKPPKPQVPVLTDRVVVLGKMSWEDTEWLDYELPEWQHAVYTVNDPKADLTVPLNKGKESNVYLQYIVDNYDKLPQYMVFLHAHQYSYHIEFEEQDNALAVKRLQLDYVDKVGYANLRCDWGPGCPNEVQPFRQMNGRTTEIAFAGAWIGIFNNSDIPTEIGTPCCAQFVVTRDQVLKRPLSDYQHYHSWLLETELDDETSGRVFEYLWHIIFGKDPITCPEKDQCYWDLYGTEYVEPSNNLGLDGIWSDIPPPDAEEGDGIEVEQNDNDPSGDLKSSDPSSNDSDSPSADTTVDEASEPR